jgi:hypothetical protein
MLEHISEARGMIDNWSREIAGAKYPAGLQAGYGRAVDALDALYDEAHPWYREQKGAEL